MSESVARSYTGDLLLSERQRRYLTDIILQLENALYLIERASHSSSLTPSLITIETEDLPALFARKAKPHLQLLRQHLKTIVQRLELAPLVISKRTLVRDEVTRGLLDLFDAGSHGLRGYGPVDPGTAAVLDTLLADFRSPLEGILKLLGPAAE